MRRALVIDEASYGADHPNVAIDLNNLAASLQATNRLGEAEPLMRRALVIDEASYGADHPNVAIDLNNLAASLQATNRLGEAEPLMRRALAIFEKSLGTDHPNTALVRENLAAIQGPPLLSGESFASFVWGRKAGGRHLWIHVASLLAMTAPHRHHEEPDRATRRSKGRHCWRM